MGSSELICEASKCFDPVRLSAEDYSKNKKRKSSTGYASVQVSIFGVIVLLSSLNVTRTEQPTLSGNPRNRFAQEKKMEKRMLIICWNKFFFFAGESGGGGFSKTFLSVSCETERQTLFIYYCYRGGEGSAFCSYLFLFNLNCSDNKSIQQFLSIRIFHFELAILPRVTHP